MSPTLLIAALWLLFIGTHLLLSHPPVRGPLVKRLGANGFSGLFSLVAMVIIAPALWIWWTHRHQGPMLWFLRGVPGITHVVELLVVLGFALAGAGLTQPGPGSMALTLSGRAPEARGVVTITRHPLFMGISLWAVCHMAMNGWATDVAFFAGYPLTTIIGGLHQDWRKSEESAAFAAVRDQTSFFPFLGLLRGQRIRLDRASWVGLGLGAASAVVLRVFHARLFG